VGEKTRSRIEKAKLPCICRGLLKAGAVTRQIITRYRGENVLSLLEKN
jgi:hypothetical protein